MIISFKFNFNSAKKKIKINILRKYIISIINKNVA